MDGHVRVYHGKHTLPKAFTPQRRLAVPATTDYWVNDQRGDSLFVVTAEANAGLAKMLPVVLKQIRKLVGQRRVTVVFDRGGYSPKLFFELIQQGFDVLTYRKGRCPAVLRVRLLPLSSPHRSRAIAALCDELNRSPVSFPGSRLRLHFSITLAPK